MDTMQHIEAQTGIVRSPKDAGHSRRSKIITAILFSGLLAAGAVGFGGIPFLQDLVRDTNSHADTEPARASDLLLAVSKAKKMDWSYCEMTDPTIYVNRMLQMEIPVTLWGVREIDSMVDKCAKKIAEKDVVTAALAPSRAAAAEQRALLKDYFK